ncbi:hypothetical protein [Ruminococcus flavefaciens]|uniref:hypothetical protein n=1 Tax=Ruminococcus flavefaciens TaxID=1265 RepID=UPI0026F30DBC|nr:hypothetical protein [Ruminococcus flavefaciens]
MKIREIILDFTSLLDVIMIILFFFVLYSTMDTQKAANKAKEAEQTYNQLIDEQQEINEKAQMDLERIESADENAAANQKALNSFDKGDFFTFRLEVTEQSDNWTLSISFGKKQLGEVVSKETDDVKGSIRGILEKSGFTADDTYLCILSYDGQQYGTSRAFDIIDKAIDDIQREYPNLYFSNLNK